MKQRMMRLAEIVRKVIRMIVAGRHDDAITSLNLLADILERIGEEDA